MSINYGRWISTAALAATVLASVLLIVKIFSWWLTGSVSLLAALVDSLVDLAASLTNFFAVRYSLQPADKEHTFGHGKAESLAALAQSMFISGSAIFLFLTGLQHLLSPKPLEHAVIGIWVIIIALISTLCLVTFQKWVLNKTQSQAIRADMLHYKSDLLMNGAILVALILSVYGFKRADALFALGIGCYILYSALRMGYDAVQSLLDRALPDEERQEIIEIIRNYPGISGGHDLKTRQSGPTRFIQFHLEMDDHLPLVQAHALAEGIENKLRNRFPGADIIIHQDPCSVIPEEHKNRWD
ncbi:CDF family cation-efflux transporter FieF [Xenorhabdus nematophila]|uniref:Cation-efflux pump FieF n=1 Tax=Xenorhabdus nematophila (strain ATCC 19061 / DSM 3370 / CCUG 14189 / LMG 1036 / NCIMB 9965 / AN6) TaxID=406817 RepID=D3VG99_XENNA|nr:CDF family cation-efflux transporter FieF [Xenorhabdus nematophila]CEE94196.1 putative transport protein (CDF family) [Xenorhabdus nematophila str. Anatoliense]CEF30986.1 putative transport protein (CDF family) [Xenorhabdus nematophila str. Websteri]AYA41599.1 CDF family cation-efflux pump FieF [Xenorhabdus nematophila]KHD28311.1 ferrous iron transporter [Xenorhabdus nematophila]MBA0020336.1 CDF family cation-efflux transporter FieF [Xenorhabdus nematophila]